MNKPMPMAAGGERSPTALLDFSKEGGRYDENNEAWEWKNEGGHLHREGDLPAVISQLGFFRAWYMNGVLHRDNGPAVVGYENSKTIDHTEWRFRGKRHRLDGPAYEGCDGVVEYYVDGEKFKDGETDEYRDACRRFRIEHGLLEPGKLTKPAHTSTTTNAAPTV